MIDGLDLTALQRLKGKYYSAASLRDPPAGPTAVPFISHSGVLFVFNLRPSSLFVTGLLARAVLPIERGCARIV